MSHPALSVAVAWLAVLTVALVGLVCIGETKIRVWPRLHREAKIRVGLVDGEVANCCAEHTEQVNHGPFAVTGHMYAAARPDAFAPAAAECAL